MVKGKSKNPDLDFLIEIHPEDGFLGGESVHVFWKKKQTNKQQQKNTITYLGRQN